jgi:hypothetical protein
MLWLNGMLKNACAGKRLFNPRFLRYYFIGSIASQAVRDMCGCSRVLAPLGGRLELCMDALSLQDCAHDM